MPERARINLDDPPNVGQSSVIAIWVVASEASSVTVVGPTSSADPQASAIVVAPLCTVTRGVHIVIAARSTFAFSQRDKVARDTTNHIHAACIVVLAPVLNVAPSFLYQPKFTNPGKELRLWQFCVPCTILPIT